MQIFSAVLLSGINKQLDALQEQEQACFRPNYSCSDIIISIRMLAEKADEWGEEIWMASLDLEKAFDMKYHASVIVALDEAKADLDIIRYLVRLYRKHVSSICLDSAKSMLFDISRCALQYTSLEK